MYGQVTVLISETTADPARQFAVIIAIVIEQFLGNRDLVAANLIKKGIARLLHRSVPWAGYGVDVCSTIWICLW